MELLIKKKTKYQKHTQMLMSIKKTTTSLHRLNFKPKPRRPTNITNNKMMIRWRRKSSDQSHLNLYNLKKLRTISPAKK